MQIVARAVQRQRRGDDVAIALARKVAFLAREHDLDAVAGRDHGHLGRAELVRQVAGEDLLVPHGGLGTLQARDVGRAQGDAGYGDALHGCRE
jgi:hypothetical protein